MATPPLTIGDPQPTLPRSARSHRARRDLDLVDTARHAVAVVSWVAFVGAWARVVARGIPVSVALRDVALIAAVLVVVATLTSWWVRHNVGIYRRKGPRRAAMPVSGALACDRLGRSLHGDLPTLRAAGEVLVVIDGTTKVYVGA